jgi:2-oxo-3-hexenedioate decarboxylase
MTITTHDLERLAEHVLHAQTTATAIHKLTIDHPGFTVADGYQVQNAVRAKYVAAGHRIVGWKAGLTSRAKMLQMGVDKPSVGFLTDRMAVADGTSVEMSALVHPKVECEVAFVLDRDLPTSGCTADDVVAATAFVVPAIEIIDSRYENFQFDLQSVIADNSSSSRYVLGSQGRRLSTVDRRTIGLALVKNGDLITTGASAAVMGDPAAAVALVANIVGSLGAQLTAGMVVLSGGITEAFAVGAGDHVSARFQSLGTVDVSFR